jgi:hypothetical protein
MQYFQKKKQFILYFIKKKKKKTKNQTLNWLAGQYMEPGVVAPPPKRIGGRPPMDFLLFFCFVFLII